MNKTEYINQNFFKKDVGTIKPLFAYFTKDKGLYIELCSLADSDKLTITDKLAEYEVTDFDYSKLITATGYPIGCSGYSKKLNKKISWNAKNNIIVYK